MLTVSQICRRAQGEEIAASGFIPDCRSHRLDAEDAENTREADLGLNP